MSRISDEMLHPNDKFVTRNRWGRLLVLVSYSTLTTAFFVVVSALLGKPLHLQTVGVFIGLAAEVALLTYTLEYFFVKVEPLSALVTINQLRVLLGFGDKKKAHDNATYPTYGPGWHIAYPWESRTAGNNIPLQEVGQDFEFPVVVADGVTLTIKGSFRIRPDIRNTMPYLSGVASISSELLDLIAAFVFARASKKDADTVIRSVKELNRELAKEFGLQNVVDGKASDLVAKFEHRFGLYVGDVTISSIRRSEEAERTRNSLDEARAIAEGTAIMLGFESSQAMQEAAKAGTITAESIDKARDRFLSVSGNMEEGMSLNRYEISLTGLDPNILKTLEPLARAYANSKGRSGRRKRSGQQQGNQK
ncbi:hypothetical protein KC722_01485 [Candidatus Kaiserbacteria bacterium]|nr:hypothetical protein [Candidatus Kaiserbacteria bacterium]